MRIQVVISSFLVAAVGCLEKFEPTSVSPNNVLVVEGQLSDLDEPNVVKLSRTRGFGMDDVVSEQGATVKVLENGVTEYMFEEAQPGVYVNPATDLRGQTGSTYTLDIVLANGARYKSEPVVFKPTPPIEEVYYESERRLTDDRTVLSGIAIFLDTYDPSGSADYYRWEWMENWEIKVPISSKFDFQVFPDTVGGGYPVPKERKNDICYSSDTSRRIMVASKKLAGETGVRKFEINYVSTQDFKLKSLYGIIVRQYSLDEKGYKYWSQLKATSEALGTLFDPQPYELRGNVFNVDDVDEAVLGYFDASAVAVNSMVVARDLLEDLEYPLEQCFFERDTVPYAQVTDFLQSGYLIDTVGPFGSTYLIMAPVDCSDCRLYGTLERPDFRPD